MTRRVYLEELRTTAQHRRMSPHTRMRSKRGAIFVCEVDVNMMSSHR